MRFCFSLREGIIIKSLKRVIFITYKLKSMGSLPIASGGFGPGLKFRDSTQWEETILRSTPEKTVLGP